MRRIKIRNKRQTIWRILRLLALVGLIITIGLMTFLEQHALVPDQLKEEGRYCEVTTEWISDAFAVETWDDVDLYDYYIVDLGERFLIMETYLDDAEILDYIESLYDEEGNYTPVSITLAGSSVFVDDDLKALAVDELSYWMDMELTVQEFDDYFYPYYLNMVDLGDYANVTMWFLAAIVFLLIGIIGGVVSGIRHGIRVAALKKRPYYEHLVDCWSSTGEKMNTGRRKLIVLSDYLIIPDYHRLVLPLKEAAWFYSMRQGKNKSALFVLCFDGNVRRLCTIKEKTGTSAEEYLGMIRLAAPWCRYGYTDENRQAFGNIDKKYMLEQIAAEKKDYLSQRPLI